MKKARLRKKDKHGYEELEHKDKFEILHQKEFLQLACCDCNLTHIIDFSIDGPRLIIEIARDDRETKKLRKK
jgi:hypothetical protein